MRDTFNDLIEPACEEDLVYPDESSEFFNEKELDEEQKRIHKKNELEKLIEQRDVLAEGYPKLQKNFSK